MKRLLLYTILILSGIRLFAQDVNFKATAPGVVELGQQFRLIFTVNAQPEKFVPPQIEDFEVLVGPSTSSSSNISIINGKMERSFTLTYTYILRSNKEGEFTIPEAGIELDRKRYRSQPIKVEVIKGSGASQGTNQQGTQQQNTQNTTTQEEIPKSDLFLKLHISRSNVFQGQHLVATIKLYTKINISGIENVKFPDFEGFLSHEIEVPQLHQLKQEAINGEIYGTGVIKKYLLYPQKTGKLTIPTAEMDIIYQKLSNRRQRSIFDDFFGTYERYKQPIKSDPIDINVKALPGVAPSSYTGGVGNLKMSAALDNYEVNVNDAITLKVKVSGNGNLKVIDPLSVEFPADFEVYDPKIIESVKYSESGGIGSKTFEYLIIPRHSGTFTIDPIKFSYFDPVSGSYKSAKSEEFVVQAARGEGDTTITMSSGFTKEDVKFLGQDIRFIKTGMVTLRKANQFIFGSSMFWGVYIIGIVLFFLILIVRQRYIKQNADIQLMKNKKASKYAQKRLKTASKYLKENKKEAFYEELVKALWGYLSDKLGIPAADLSKDNVHQELSKREIEDQLINDFLAALDNCEYARYAPGSGSEQMDESFKNSMNVISKLHQKLK